MMSEWKGTNKEIIDVINYVMCEIQETEDIRLSSSDLKKCFLEAFTRNVVQEELKSCMSEIYEESL